MYGWRQEDPLFAAEWDEAIEAGTDKLEDEARRRALSGSDALIQFLLKARRPGKYRERALLEHTGPVGEPVQVEVGSAREELAGRIAEIVVRSALHYFFPSPSRRGLLSRYPPRPRPRAGVLVDGYGTRHR